MRRGESNFLELKLCCRCLAAGCELLGGFSPCSGVLGDLGVQVGLVGKGGMCLLWAGGSEKS